MRRAIETFLLGMIVASRRHRSRMLTQGDVAIVSEYLAEAQALGWSPGVVAIEIGTGQ